MRQTRIRKLQRNSENRDIVAAIATPDDRRFDSRHFAQQYVAMRSRSSSLICDLIDLSETGAKIRVLDGAVPSVDEKLLLTLFDGTDVAGRVSWLNGKHIGIAFISPVSDVDERLDFEDLGSAYFGKAVRLQRVMRRS